MIEIVLSEYVAEDIAYINELKDLGISEEEIQKAYKRTLEERSGKNENKIL